MTLTIDPATADWRAKHRIRAVAANMCPECYGPAPAAGVDCLRCAAHYDPDAQAYGSAQARLDDGEYTHDERPGLERIVEAYERAEQVAEVEAGRVPNGCRYCGVEDRDHVDRWDGDKGTHGWTQPRDAHRIFRIKARRAIREGRLYLLVGHVFRSLVEGRDYRG